MQITAAGDRALLVTLSGASSARLRAASVALRSVPGVVTAIVGHESLYVIGSTDRAAVTRAIDDAENTPMSEGTHHRIEVSLPTSTRLICANFSLQRICHAKSFFVASLMFDSPSVTSAFEPASPISMDGLRSGECRAGQHRAIWCRVGVSGSPV